MLLSFKLGSEKVKRLRPADIEALYMSFDDAVEHRLNELWLW